MQKNKNYLFNVFATVIPPIVKFPPPRNFFFYLISYSAVNHSHKNISLCVMTWGDYSEKYGISIYNDRIIKYKGKLHIYNIQYQLGILNYNINEIFYSICMLNNNKFKLIKDIKKYKFKIEFMILNKKRYINIELYDNINNNDENEYIKRINELKEIRKELNNKIKLLEEELNKHKNKRFNN